MLERDVIKFAIPELDQESTMLQKLSRKVALVTAALATSVLPQSSDLSMKVPMSLSRVVVRLSLTQFKPDG
jgi:hypothetical protein